MKTIVYQSYRTQEVPAWINRCMETVRDWAKMSGFDYEFIDDRLFDFVPKEYLEKVRRNICMVSDLARLVIAREYLNKGYARTIWVDADVIIFNPNKFIIDVSREFAFCREIWVHIDSASKLVFTEKVNNSVTVFTGGNTFLDFYIYAIKSMVQNKKEPLLSTDAGTQFLTRLYPHSYFNLLRNIGLFSPVLIWGILNDKTLWIRKYMELCSQPLVAANLCNSFRGTTFSGIKMHDGMYDQVIEILQSSRGEVLNKYLAEN